MLPPEVLPALQGIVPSAIATVSASGEPNVANISQVFYVDDKHVALSNQFFSKTSANIAENPYAFVQLVHPKTMNMWFLELRYVRAETSGPVFDAMEMQLEAIATRQDMTGVFALKAAEIYEVLSVREATEASGA